MDFDHPFLLHIMTIIAVLAVEGWNYLTSVKTPAEIGSAIKSGDQDLMA